MARRVEVTGDGWFVPDLRDFEILRDHPPPRPYGYWRLLRQDVREPKVLRMWAIGIGFPVAAALTRLWPLALAGVPSLLTWTWLSRSVIRLVRNADVATAVVEELEPHPVLPAILFVGRAAQPTGEPVDVAMSIPLGGAIAREGLPAEVLILDDPKWQYKTIFAARPLRGRGA